MEIQVVSKGLQFLVEDLRLYKIQYKKSLPRSKKGVKEQAHQSIFAALANRSIGQADAVGFHTNVNRW